MSIKIILVPLDGSEESFKILDTAVIVANRFDAHIEVVHVMQRPADCVPFVFDSVSAKLKNAVTAEAEEDVREQAAEVRKTFEQFCETNGVVITDDIVVDKVTAAWREEFGRVSEVLVRRGRLADAVAIARPAVRKSTIRRSPVGENLQAVMLRTGRPVLIVPPGWKPHQVEHAAIGWNESLEASRALAMVMPWLPQMASVNVIVSRKRQPRVQALLDYLAWHDVKADVQLLDGRGDSVGTAMLNICSDVGADFLVVGGFSHARARELLFGGVTRHLLAHSSIMTVMVH